MQLNSYKYIEAIDTAMEEAERFLDRAATVHVGPEGIVGRFREVVVGVEDALALGQVADRIDIVLSATAAIGAEDQLMLQAKGFKLTVDIGVQAVVFVIVVQQGCVAGKRGGRVAIVHGALAGRVFDVLQVAAVYSADF